MTGTGKGTGTIESGVRRFRRLLVVEDDPNQRNMICLILSNAGYGIIEAVSVRTALMHLDVIDLSGIVLDLHLPNGKGKKVVDELMAKRDDVPVVIISGFPEEAPRDFPIIAVLEKPFKREGLINAARAASELSDALKDIRNTTRRLREKSSSIFAKPKIEPDQAAQ